MKQIQLDVPPEFLCPLIIHVTLLLTRASPALIDPFGNKRGFPLKAPVAFVVAKS
jgi:hypothetical protein